MQPLLHDHDPTLSMNGGKRDVTVGHTTAADMDSEQDDTLYVLTQMQKSRESLAVSTSLFKINVKAINFTQSTLGFCLGFFRKDFWSTRNDPNMYLLFFFSPK